MKKHIPVWLSILGVIFLLVTACAQPAAPTPAPTKAPTSAPTAAATTPAQTKAPTAAPTTPAAAVKMPSVMSIATAGVGTTSYIAASAFADVTQKGLGVKLSVESSGATARWVPLMKTGDIDLALGCDPSGLKDAYYGLNDWKTPGPQPVMYVATGQVQPFMFDVVDPNIKTMADLKGKKFYAYMKTMRILNQLIPELLTYGGVDPKSVDLLTYNDINEATQGIANGNAVGVFYIPTVLPIVELDKSKPVYNIPVSEEIVKKVQADFPEIGFMVWKKGDGISKSDTPGIALPCQMSARADLNPDVLYTFLKNMYAHYDDYKGVHPIMASWTPQQAVSIFPSPEHPGAIKYFKEAGVWGAEQEAKQQKLLATPRGQ